MQSVKLWTLYEFYWFYVNEAEFGIIPENCIVGIAINESFADEVAGDSYEHCAVPTGQGFSPKQVQVNTDRRKDDRGVEINAYKRKGGIVCANARKGEPTCARAPTMVQHEIFYCPTAVGLQ
ncbi:hypothetical protein MSG28_002862 [Choristoneura fumiferana]|uniref:Uncharacterized protein n=1 Tax=Choristoneura fumiferana TaxID=7141 RepID=A0ACC0JJI6_CHOFU|nr:hypothetical protein MSG28_002862 [Choristoneura fumiferana]